MQKDMTILAKETIFYGGSTALCKFLNWLLVFLHTTVLEKSEYGNFNVLYSHTALLLVILTYGMETGFFRFVNRKDKSPSQVYTTILTCLGVTSILFVFLSCLFAQQIVSVDFLQFKQKDFFVFIALIVAMDAFASIPFAYLRYKKRPIRFLSLKVLQVILNIVLSIFFLIICPNIQHLSIISAWYNPDYNVGYLLLSNLMATGIQTLCLLPEIFSEKYSFSWPLLCEILIYSLPILVLGVVGTANLYMDRFLFCNIYPGGKIEAESQLGIYSACAKVAVVMTMFTTAFRYAYEPYVFSKHKDKNSVEAYADAMKYYLLFSFLILLGTTFYLDILKFIIHEDYWRGLKVVPIVLWTYVFQGVYLNLSYWYKLTDETKWGIYFSLIGLAITIILQVLFVPIYSYMASAMSGTLSFFICMLLSYFIGKRHIAIPYDFKTIGKYTVLTLLLLGIYYAVRKKTPIHAMSVSMVVGTVLLAIYIFVLTRKDFPLSAIPVVGKYINKNPKQNLKQYSDMSLFDKIANLISEKENKQESYVLKENSSPLNEKTGSDQNEVSPDDTIHLQESPAQDNSAKVEKQELPSLETREELLQNLCDLSCELFDNVELSAGNRLVVWFDTDQLTFRNYNTEQYRQRVMAALVNECDVKFDAIAFNVGKPAEELRCTPVGKSGKIFMQVVEEQPAQTSTSGKAIISIFGNAGSLLKKEYILSSDEMKEKRISSYNIGSGEFPQVPTGYRQNHIAIDDNPNGNMIEKNKFVSRMHAHIGYSDNFGFYLQVERDGTRLMGKRTRIFRGEQKIELDNPQIKEPLQDGDLIELGKAVVLRYTQVNS